MKLSNFRLVGLVLFFIIKSFHSVMHQSYLKCYTNVETEVANKI